MENTVPAVTTETEIKDQQQTPAPQPTTAAATLSGSPTSTLALQPAAGEEANSSDEQEEALIVSGESTGVANTVDDSPPTEQPEFTIDLELVDELRQMFDKTVCSKFFMGNPNRIKALKDALYIPISDDRSFQLFFYHAENDLVNTAYKNARKSGTAPQEITISDIVAEAQKRYKSKHGKEAIVNEEYEA